MKRVKVEITAILEVPDSEDLKELVDKIKAGGLRQKDKAKIKYVSASSGSTIAFARGRENGYSY